MNIIYYTYIIWYGIKESQKRQRQKNPNQRPYKTPFRKEFLWKRNLLVAYFFDDGFAGNVNHCMRPLKTYHNHLLSLLNLWALQQLSWNRYHFGSHDYLEATIQVCNNFRIHMSFSQTRSKARVGGKLSFRDSPKPPWAKARSKNLDLDSDSWNTRIEQIQRFGLFLWCLPRNDHWLKHAWPSSHWKKQLHT